MFSYAKRKIQENVIDPYIKLRLDPYIENVKNVLKKGEVPNSKAIVCLLEKFNKHKDDSSISNDEVAQIVAQYLRKIETEVLDNLVDYNPYDEKKSPLNISLVRAYLRCLEFQKNLDPKDEQIALKYTYVRCKVMFYEHYVEQTSSWLDVRDTSCFFDGKVQTITNPTWAHDCGKNLIAWIDATRHIKDKGYNPKKKNYGEYENSLVLTYEDFIQNLDKKDLLMNKNDILFACDLIIALEFLEKNTIDKNLAKKIPEMLKNSIKLIESTQNIKDLDKELISRKLNLDIKKLKPDYPLHDCTFKFN